MRDLLGISVHCFMDIECMRHQLDNFEKIGVGQTSKVRYFNGRFEGFDAKYGDIDPQETFNLIHQYKFAEIIKTGVKKPIDALNYKLESMGKDFEFCLNLDTDEFLEGDWDLFYEGVETAQKEYPDELMFFVPFEDKTGVYPEYTDLQKLYHNTNQLYLQCAHMWFFAKETKQRVEPRHGVRGIKIIQDDKCRPDWRERAQCHFQQKNRRKEQINAEKFIQEMIERGELKDSRIAKI